MATVGWIDTASSDLHTLGSHHPERPERLHVIRAALARHNLERSLEKRVAQAACRSVLERVHQSSYLDALQRMCGTGGGAWDADTFLTPYSWQVACHAAGAVVDAVKQVVAGSWQRAFCSVRPPGHHATAEAGMGFCLLNNVAIGAQAALDSAQVGKVAVLDWDVHHGNGTQAIFWDRADVLYISWHQSPFYPGTGAVDDIGAGAGRGATLNCPLAAGSGDAEYLDAWHLRIRPALDVFEPELLLISAGFDADARDPLGGLTVSAQGLTQLSKEVVCWADAHCAGRMVSVLEGGYALDALAEDVPLHVGTLLISP